MIAAGLGHAHARGVVHRDVKPANVLVIRDGSRETAKITDFGIARVLGGERRTNADLTLGTLWYMAPEQAQNSAVDARADVYSLGATLYEALTGRVLFPYHNAAQVLAAHITETPRAPSTLAPGIPRPLEDLVMRCVSKRPEERPADGNVLAAMLSELERIAWAPLAALPSASPPAPSHPPMPATAPASIPAPPAGGPQSSIPIAEPGALPLPAEDIAIGWWIGVGGLALVTMTCLAGVLLGVLTGFLHP